MGFLGINISKEFGGGMNNIIYGLVCQEIERGDSGLRSFISVQNSLVMYPIFAFGTESQKKKWKIAQWTATCFLWHQWLAHDIANVAVYLPRGEDLSLEMLIVFLTILVIGLGRLFYNHGGKIQEIVSSKSGTRFVRSATIIDFVYAIILLYFKQYNDIPMSTTWVFVGLLCGRELAISTMNKEYKLRYVFPIIGKDFLKMIFGLSVSVGIVLSIHYIFIPNGF